MILEKRLSSFRKKAAGLDILIRDGYEQALWETTSMVEEQLAIIREIK